MNPTNDLKLPDLLPVQPRSIATKDLWISGWLLISLGVFHILVWLVVGGVWEGPLSLRKPILFGISTGVTLISVASIFDRLRPARYDSLIIRILSVSLVLEVLLITFQQWRGQASHFNHDSFLNTSIEYAMTTLIVVATVILAQIAFRAFNFLNTARDLQIANRAGLAFLIISCLIGFFILWNGNKQVLAGQDPSTYGKAGVAKFPHGIAIHSLQFFPLLCYLLAKIGLGVKKRIGILKWSIASMGGMLTYSIYQTLSGKPRFEWTPAGALIFAISIGLLAPVAWEISKQLAVNAREVIKVWRSYGRLDA
ncbi:MAG: hypothetical protein GY818_07935 [Planctomycetaceae bacterium]|nr:hypothetical protein [Planctomycetaceae bacterium]